jgi:hypothetical protein
LRCLNQPNKRLEIKETKQDRQGILQNAENNNCLSFHPQASCYPSPSLSSPCFLVFGLLHRFIGFSPSSIG